MNAKAAKAIAASAFDREVALQVAEKGADLKLKLKS